MADLERQSERPDTESEDTGDRAAQRGQAPPTAPDAWVLGGGRGEDDLGFMPETSAALLQDSPRGGRLILWIAVAFFAAAFTWAAFAKLDEVTRGVGRVIPSRQVQVVQSLDGGIVSDIDVKEGQIVDEGQVLLRIDST
ncbi:MAG TPA: biotin/lipoyl-binding protein, partial [Gammaproteobacteria bacterium]|nr:biotin/lipoyl-binding protein [Gammaproteobacteria bacterium]